MHLLHQFMRLQRGDPFGRNGRQHADGDPVAPVECQVLFDQRLGSVQHHGKDLRAGLLGQREGPGLEAVDLTVLRARALGKNRHRSPARNPLFPVADQLFQRLGGVAAVDADVAVQQEELAEEGRFEDLALRHPAEIERNVVERRDVDHRVVVDDDDVALLPVDQFAADDPLPPKGRQEEENPHQDARQFMHRPAPPVEGIADDQRKGRQNHKKRAQKHQQKVV